eukprot:TRINITY_DN6053_c0_g1_i1.p1 TRINITY_DN6053_c0_g1~~TRINITY_DN6053_c0_g1_i1.p1  ORF type:complete len:476 (+),score=104.01 TRINITY_DN6053_c0_g1_i1:97-1524(+)
MSMDDWKLVSVGKVARTIRELCDEKGLPFTPTCGYYELSRKENISKDKLLVAVEEEEDVVIQGKENVREKLKLATGALRVGPDDLPEGWSLYIQSTSHNRRLVPGTTAMIFLGSASRGAATVAGDDSDDSDSKAKSKSNRRRRQSRDDPWKIVSVGKTKLTVSELCEAKGLPYTPACGFYELTRRETISANKSLVACHEEEGTVIHGNDNVRETLGLESGSIAVKPGDIPDGWSLYIQSTAASRGLLPGTTAIIYVGSKPVDDSESESAKPVKTKSGKKPPSKKSRKASSSSSSSSESESENARPAKVKPGKKPISKKSRHTSSSSESESEKPAKQKSKKSPKKADKRQKKDPMDSWKLVTVGKKKLTVAELCVVKGLQFTPGCGYYELTRRETISAGKTLVACHEEEGTVIHGTDNVRKELKLGSGSISVKPTDIPEDWSLYIQSTSANRGLLPGTTAMIYVSDNANDSDSDSD